MADVDYLIPLIQDLIREEMAAKIWFALGIVTAYDQLTHTAKVFLHNEQVETDFIRISVGFSGNNYGEKKPLEIDTEVAVSFDGGDPTSGIIIGSLYSDPLTQPPSSLISSKDWGVKNAIGASLIIKENGDIEATNSSGATLTLTQAGGAIVVNQSGEKFELKPDGTYTLTGVAGKKLNMDNTGKLTTNTGSLSTNQAFILKAFLNLFDTHTHLGNLGYPTGAPIIQTGTVPDLTSDGV